MKTLMIELTWPDGGKQRFTRAAYIALEFDEIDGTTARIVEVEHLDVRDVERSLSEIRRASEECDDGAAHAKEDALYLAVLSTIAAGRDDAAELAALALKSKDIEFKRWVG